ncbi:MAG TPA: DNA polymerase III subunit alpha [Candidatus Cloacimonadota bacterium]|nr:DNA polymerase III subunit alpha [Candidatus Cloacimonadota bacterium]HOV16922.1 DNA polymerase III subunit alpha [Candidatus Cloacimonadota bacterium]HQL14168.1 DNA polymerase III subunit alpha [Candidatus Cloacimonadota bacterium]
MSFVHLHNHTQYSLLDGACRIDRMVKRAKQYEMPALAITDHGNMFGAIEFYNACREEKIKPILGLEAYIVNKSFAEENKKNENRYHLILLAMNDQGYHNLIKLSSKSYLEGFYYKPRINKELLEQYNEGLICLSACIQGEIAQQLLKGQVDQARKAAKWYKNLFGDRYYLEIQSHGLEEENTVMPQIISLSKELDIPLVLTNDCHYLQQSDSEAHDILLCIQTGKSLTDPNRMKYNTNQLFFRSPEEMKQLFPELPEAYNNTLEIAERVDFELRYENFLLPSVETPPEFESMYDYLRALCLEGIKKKYGEPTQEITDRLNYELDLVHRMGFDGYFLVVKDFIDNARLQQVPVGPGRGSAAGSIIAYLLDITKIDPLKYNLMFERFLNPDRISMPDIDIDFCAQGRSKVIDYVVQKYGRNSVTQIITFSTLGPKSVIKDVARVLGVSATEANKMTKAIPSSAKTLVDAVKSSTDFVAIMNSNDLYASILKYSYVLEGLVRQTGIHAAGVVIVPGDLTDYVPLAVSSQKDNENAVLVQYEGKCLEQLKILKIDFLGLKTLTLIHKAIDLIEEAQNVKIDIDNLPLDDKKTYELLAKGQTDGIFQFESDGMKKYLINLKPNQFEDLIAMVALYRPGPMASIDTYIRRKHGKEKIVYDHPLCEHILKETYGVTVYQEQVMQIAREMAGFTGGEADSLRSAMSKKKADLMEQFRHKFHDGASANKVPEKVINKIWDDWSTFAEYAFNKSHATCYALVAYQTAWLKAHYPVEFMAALLSLEDNPDKIPYFLEECKRMKIKIIPPNINISQCDFSVQGKEIRFGLRAIKNLGENTIRAIVEEREKKGPYKSIFDLCMRLDSFSVNKTVLESLTASGAMDDLEGTRAQKWNAIELALEHGGEHQRDFKRGQTLLFDLLDDEDKNNTDNPPLPEASNWSHLKQLEMEKSVLGFYLSGHPLEPYKELIELLTTNRAKNEEKGNGKDVRVVGIVVNVTKKKGNKGNPMAFVEMEDLVGKYELALFNYDYEQFLNQLEVGKLFYIVGNRSQYNNGEEKAYRIIPKKIFAFDALPFCLKGEVTLELKENDVNEEFIKYINKLKNKASGHFNMKLKVKTKDFNTLILQTQAVQIFPDRDFIRWCAENNYKVKAEVEYED